MFYQISPPPSKNLFPYTTLFRSRTPCAASRWTAPRSPTPSARRERPASRRRSRAACPCTCPPAWPGERARRPGPRRSEEHTSELQSLRHLVCRLLLEKKNVAVSL